MAETGEAALIRAATRGDGAAFAELIRPSYALAFRVAYGMLQDYDEAEDAIQEASLKAWRRLANLREGANLRPWFLGIVANQCRSTSRTPWSSVSMEVDQSVATDAPADAAASVAVDFPQEPRGGAYERLHDVLESRRIKPRRMPFRLNPPEPGPRPLAATLIILLVATISAAGSVAYYGLSHGLLRVHTPHFSGTCSRGFQMTDATHGWNGVGAKTDDGGKTWSSVRLPAGGAGECIFGPQNAWVASPFENSPTEASAVVFATSDGGETWTQGGSIPLADPNSSITLEFIDSSRGWMLTEATNPDFQGGRRAFFSTSDGSRSWARVLEAGSGLQQARADCFAAGMTFINPTTGWISYSCDARYRTSTGDLGPVVMMTTDGGHHWQNAELPGLPSGESAACSAGQATFTRAVGVIPVFCSEPSLWAGVYRTVDGGRYWTWGRLPAPVHTEAIDFVDATTGYAYDDSEHQIYRTIDSGSTWSVVAVSLFVGQTDPIDFDYINDRTGFAYLGYYSNALWKTIDGGRTWTSVSGTGNPSADACRPYETPTTPGLVAMLGPSTAWALGGFRTGDGGSHWVPAGPPDVPNRAWGSAEFYLDANHAWVAETTFSSDRCGDQVHVFSTSDGGLTWRQAAPIHVSLPEGTGIWGYGAAASVDSPAWSEPEWMDFVDPMHGWLMLIFFRPQGGPSTGPIYRTSDGGATWSEVSDEIPGDFSCGFTPSMRFSSPTTGWIGDQPCRGGPTVYVTRDGGATWQSQLLPLDCPCSAGTPVFFDRDRGVIVASDGAGVVLLATTDGGKSWISKRLPGDRVDSVYMIDLNHVWLSGINSNGGLRDLEYSSDGGTTWKVMTLPPIPLYGQLTYRFVDASNGMLSAEDSLYRTTDSGGHWTKVDYEVAS